MEEQLLPNNALLIFIDLQLGAISTIQSIPQQDLKNNAVALAKIASILKLPTIFAGADIPGDAGNFLPLGEILPDHVYVKHSTNNSWETPEFVAAVEKTGCKYLIMAGLATDVGLCLTAIDAVKAGYKVYAIIDVSGTLNARIEQAAWLRMIQAGVILTNWSAFAGEIQRDYTKEPGKLLKQVIGETLGLQHSPF